jgi:glutamyl/glutaminyl-tRNA synthetase
MGIYIWPCQINLFAIWFRFKIQCPVNLRFDDTNPAKRNRVRRCYKEDLKWFGFQWAEERYASDYFQQLYEWAVMIKRYCLHRQSI